MTISTDPSGLVLDEPRDRNAACRSRLYALFAEALSYPQGSAALRLLDGDLLADIQDLAAVLDLPLDCPSDLLVPNGQHAISDIQRLYSELFDVAAGMPAVSLLERRYGDEPEQKLWENLLAFYAHFGLDFSHGYAQEQPDHLLTELAFMHYLSFLEAGAVRGVDDLRRGQRDFLSLHLGRWVASLHAKLGQPNARPPYSALAELLRHFVAVDLERLDSRLGPAK
jgi:DMSO reductase family type II enzyme chaperone